VVKEAICLSFRTGTKLLLIHRTSATPCLIGNDVPDSTHQPLRMFAGEHKHSQSRHAAAGGRGRARRWYHGAKCSRSKARSRRWRNNESAVVVVSVQARE
jgi:hypothetical protein